MIGEFGGLGLLPPGSKQWAPGRCFSYRDMPSESAFVDQYVSYLYQLAAYRDEGHGSACIYTQATDVECECDGMLHYDRTHKLGPSSRRRIAEAHRYLIHGLGSRGMERVGMSRFDELKSSRLRSERRERE